MKLATGMQSLSGGQGAYWSFNVRSDHCEQASHLALQVCRELLRTLHQEGLLAYR